jgi:cell division protein FtsA
VVADIIEPRAEEIFALVRRQLEESGYLEQLAAGIVLCGGAVLLEGMQELAEEVLGLPARNGDPIGTSGLTDLTQGPQFATAVGLARFGARTIAQATTRMETISTISAKPDRQQASENKNGFWGWLKQAF